MTYLYAYIFGYFLNLFLFFKFNKDGMPQPFKSDKIDNEPISLWNALGASFLNPLLLFILGFGIVVYRGNLLYKKLDKKFQGTKSTTKNTLGEFTLND